MNLYYQPHRLLLHTGPPAQPPRCPLRAAGRIAITPAKRISIQTCRRLAFKTADQAAARLSSRGLKKSVLHQIPVAVYGAGIRIPATECPICLGKFMDGEKVRILPKCHHGFHVRCIGKWLASHSSCPTCRHSLLEKSESGDEDGILGGGISEISVTNSSGHGNLSSGSVDEVS